MNKDLEHNMDSCLAGDCDSCTEEFEMNKNCSLKCAENLKNDVAKYIKKLETENALYAARQLKTDTELKLKINAVDHPAHYKRDIECIDEMIEVFGVGMVRNFCLLNVWKYRYRAEEKNGKEDIEKSDWYMKKYFELKH